MARVVIDKATLKRHRACSAAYTSPEWDEAAQAVVYSDWDATVERFLAKGEEGIGYLKWYVRHKLVPMTQEDLDDLLESRGVKR